MKKLFFLFFAFSFFSLSGFDFNLKNQLQMQGRLFEKSSQQRYHLNVNYKPNCFVTFYQNERFSFDSELVGNVYFSHQKTDMTEAKNFDFELYRSWFRFSALQYEARIGLQKINFGSAQILRPLQWFDTINPNDPLESSKGVYALLYRYYFLNSANIWFWSIAPKEDHVKIDNIDLESEGYEFGGRFQYPFKFCEAAINYHHREFDGIYLQEENRFGFDLRWNLEMGVWLENSLSQFAGKDTTLYAHFLTIGTDYTLSFGNGLNFIFEHMFDSYLQNEFPEPLQDSSKSAFSLSYPLNIFDAARLIIYYDWIFENYYFFGSFSRNYDYIGLYLNFFLNPDFNDYPLPANNQDGKSIQLLIELNF